MRKLTIGEIGSVVLFIGDMMAIAVGGAAVLSGFTSNDLTRVVVGLILLYLVYPHKRLGRWHDRPLGELIEYLRSNDKTRR